VLQTIFSFYGVLVGATIAGGIALWQVQLITAREREARQVERAQELADRARALQRESLLALQDAAIDLYGMIRREHFSRIREWRKTGSWTARELAELPDEWDLTAAKIGMLRSRIFDEDLRRLVRELFVAAGRIATPRSAEEANERYLDLTQAIGRIRDRSTTLLPELF
jgi:hypothetical protein